VISRPRFVLRDKHVDIARGRALGVADGGENVRLFELPLVVILAESAEQHGRLVERLRIDACRIATTFAVNKQRAAKHAVLPHEVFDGADLLLFIFLSPCGVGSMDGADIRGGEQQSGTGHAGGDQEPATSTMRIGH
jgi:hypothetical protein